MQKHFLQILIVLFYLLFGTTKHLGSGNCFYKDLKCWVGWLCQIFKFFTGLLISKAYCAGCDTSPLDLPGWLQIESSSCSPISLSALLCSSVPLPSPQTCQNPIVLHSLKIWSQFRKHYGLVSMSVYSPMTANHLFPASLQGNAFIQCLKNGMLILKMLCKDGVFMSHNQVRHEFSLTTSNFFRYLQVRHFIQNHLTQFPSLPPKSPLESLKPHPRRREQCQRYIQRF